MIWLVAFWQFGSAGMLAWTAAAALPILIHLWSRRRYNRQTWAAMTFLLAAVRKNARRAQVQQWLLLAVRVAILVLLALALADPQWSLSPANNGGSAGPTHVVIVIDGSFSMDYRSDDSSRFQTAKDLAKQLVSGGQPGDAYTILLMAAPPRVVIAGPAFNVAEVLQEIDDLEQLHGGANLPATLAEVESILRSESGQRFAARRVQIFSDLQLATWVEVSSADCRARLARLESFAALELVDLGQPDESNLAVARLWVDQPLVAAGCDVQIRAEVQSFAREARQRQALEVLVDGQRIADERIDCPAGGNSTVSLKHRFAVPGEHIIEARLGDDRLPLDNRRWLSVPVRETIRVLCIGGRPGETRYLALALSPQRASRQSLEVIEATENRLLEDLSAFDGLFLCNIGRFNQAEAAALHRFVSRGGGLIVFLGDQAELESYNRRLAGDPASRLLPATLNVLSPTGMHRLDPLEYRHAIVAPFRGFPQAGLLTTPIWKYVRLSPLEGATTALAFDNGDPAIVETQVGRGKCILFATAASTDSFDRNTDPPTPWTALPTWSSFPPLVHEALRHALSGRDDERNFNVGEELTALLPISSANATVTISGPGGLNERLAVQPEGLESRWTYGLANLSGTYETKADAAVQRFAVNIDATEGDLARLEPALLPGQLTLTPKDLGSKLAVPPASQAAAAFRGLLAAVLLLLVAEPWLARQFGKGRR